MSDKRKKSKSRLTYRHHKNATCVSVYDPTGTPIPAAVRDEVESSVWAVAQQHGLLINIART